MKELIGGSLIVIFVVLLIYGAGESRDRLIRTIEIEAIKNYLNNPSTYQVDSISINGVFDHIEVKKL